MAEVYVSHDALSKVKSALNDYEIDILGFFAKLKRCSDDISRECDREMEIIAKEIKESKQLIDELKRTKQDDELRKENLRLECLNNKEGRMKSALERLKDNKNMLLSFAKSFETQAISQTEKTSSSIKKCIDIIDDYLSS